VTELLIHAFGIPTASPVSSLDRISKILEVHTYTHTHTHKHTHTVRDSDVLKNTMSL